MRSPLLVLAAVFTAGSAVVDTIGEYYIQRTTGLGPETPSEKADRQAQRQKALLEALRRAQAGLGPVDPTEAALRQGVKFKVTLEALKKVPHSRPGKKYALGWYSSERSE